MRHDRTLLKRWARANVVAEAFTLCGSTVSPAVGEEIYAYPGKLLDAYRELEGTPFAQRLSLAVADLLDHFDADVRANAAYFFAIHPAADGHERTLDIVENGPRHRVQCGCGEILPAFWPPADIPKCFEQALNRLAELGNPRAEELRVRSDLSELLKRTSE